MERFRRKYSNLKTICIYNDKYYIKKKFQIEKVKLL